MQQGGQTLAQQGSQTLAQQGGQTLALQGGKLILPGKYLLSVFSFSISFLCKQDDYQHQA